MKITKVECLNLSYPMEETLYNGNAKLNRRGCILVRLYTDEGITGLGEAFGGGGPAISTITVIEKELAPLIIGENPLMIERLWAKCYHNTMLHARGGLLVCAMSGIDTALWDIKGKYAGLPVYRLLGGYQNRVEAYASAGFYRKGDKPDSTAKELKAFCDAEGFRAVKLKVGRTHTSGNPLYLKEEPDYCVTFEEDLERVHQTRLLLGTEVKIMVDANNAWDLHYAMRAGRYFDELNVYLFEEPVCTDDHYASAQLTRELCTKIAGYETEQLVGRYLSLIADNAVDVVQPDISWVGGITEAKKISDLAAAYHKESATHCFGSAVLLAAGLHLSCAIPNSGLLEVDRNKNPLRDDLLVEPIRVDADGFITVSEKPGLGVELREDIVQQYRIACE